MQLRNLLADEDAASPVIGVILMVAITVILAAVIGTFVLGLGNQVDADSPRVSWGFEFDENFDGGPDTNFDEQVVVTHEGGDAIDTSKLSIAGVSPDDSTYSLSLAPSTLAAGDEFVIQDNGETGGATTPPNPDDSWGSGDTLRLVWTTADGDNSATIGKYEVP